jgi:hypothetical protein
MTAPRSVMSAKILIACESKKVPSQGYLSFLEKEMHSEDLLSQECFEKLEFENHIAQKVNPHLLSGPKMVGEGDGSYHFLLIVKINLSRVDSLHSQRMMEQLKRVKYLDSNLVYQSCLAYSLCYYHLYSL